MSIFNIDDKMNVESKIQSTLKTNKYLLLHETENGNIEITPGTVSIFEVVWYQKMLQRFIDKNLDFIEYEATDHDISYLSDLGKDAEVTEFKKEEDE